MSSLAHDVNGDGIRDVVATAYEAGTLFVLLGMGVTKGPPRLERYSAEPGERRLRTVFQQTNPVDTLEAIARQLGTDAQRYADNLPVPPAKEEGQLLAATMDVKGVPPIPAELVTVKVVESRRLAMRNVGYTRSEAQVR